MDRLNEEGFVVRYKPFYCKYRNVCTTKYWKMTSVERRGVWCGLVARLAVFPSQFFTHKVLSRKADTTLASPEYLP